MTASVDAETLVPNATRTATVKPMAVDSSSAEFVS